MSLQPLLHHVHDGPWTWDDLPDREQLQGWRAEIVDGALVLMPPPLRDHDRAAFRLAVLLDAACPADLRVMTGGGVAYPPTWRVPDAMVYSSTAPGRGPVPGEDVVLAVEVQSPGSVTNDRITKPHEYSRVLIPHFWRVEIEPEALLQAFSLIDGTYAEVVTVRGDDSFTFMEPFEVTVCPAELLA